MSQYMKLFTHKMFQGWGYNSEVEHLTSHLRDPGSKLKHHQKKSRIPLGKSKIKVPKDTVSGDSLLPDSQMVLFSFSLYSHMTGNREEQAPCFFLL